MPAGLAARDAGATLSAMSEPSLHGPDVVLGLAVASARMGATAGRIALSPAALIARAPGLRGPVQRVLRDLAAEGRRSRPRLEADLERTIASIMESRLIDELTDRLLHSPEMDRIVEYIATSPQVMEAVSRHTQSLAEEMVSDVRRRSQSVDDLAERTVRGWLRRPRPLPT
jgi:hypothetical protein